MIEAEHSITAQMKLLLNTSMEPHRVSASKLSRLQSLEFGEVYLQVNLGSNGNVN